jgi:hypothetical protein
MTSETGSKESEHHRCPTCGCKSFRPTVEGDVGPLYYYLGACEECGELLHCCTTCRSWAKRKYGSNVCKYCGHSYYLPTEAEEKERLEKGNPSFLSRSQK